MRTNLKIAAESSLNLAKDAGCGGYICRVSGAGTVDPMPSVRDRHARNHQPGGPACGLGKSQKSADRWLQKLWKTYISDKTNTEVEERLIFHYLPLVKVIVSRLAITMPTHIDLGDIESVGILGLIQSIRSYDPTTGTPFEKYAQWRIRGAIIDELRKSGPIPRSTHAKARKIQEAIANFEQTYQRFPTEAEVANELGITVKQYANWLDQTRPLAFLSLDSPIDPDNLNESSLHEVIQDPCQNNPYEEICTKDLVALIELELNRLPPVYQKVLTLYYIHGLHLKEIGRVLGLTESRICQIHTAAVLKLKQAVQQKNQLTAAT